jgi:hypothetical protein
MSAFDVRRFILLEEYNVSRTLSVDIPQQNILVFLLDAHVSGYAFVRVIAQSLEEKQGQLVHGNSTPTVRNYAFAENGNDPGNLTLFVWKDISIEEQ